MSNNRDYKKFVKGNFYHIYNRGNGKMEIFRDRDDYLLFLRRLRENLYPHLQAIKTFYKGQYVAKLLPPNSFDIVCYCLMPNHFHLLIYQKTDIPISVLISKICTSYSKCFNKKYERVGTLFQDRFKAVNVKSNDQLLWLSAYIHNNPIKNGLVKNLEKYPYSSYGEYMDMSSDTLCRNDIIMDQYKKSSNYKRYISNLDSDDILYSDIILEDD